MNDRFFKYMSSEVCKIVLNTSTLRFTHPNEFNDPFDFHPALSKIGVNKYVKRISEDRPNILKGKKSNFKKIIKNISILHSQQFRDKNSKLFCVTCFSKTPYSLPMWAHYANKHNGCVIEFRQASYDELEKDLVQMNLINDSYHLLPMDVIYSDERPLVYDENGLSNTDKTGFSSALIKAKAWSYEQEVRVIRRTSSGDFKFNTAQIIAVYIGMKVQDSAAKEISNIIKKLNKELGLSIKTYKIVMEYDTFNISRVKY